MSTTIKRQVVALLFTKIREHFFIFTTHPARRIGRRVFPNTLSPVFVTQPERNQIELQYPNCTDHNFILAQRFEDLGRAFLSQLLYALFELFRPQRIFDPHPPEQLRRKVWDTNESMGFALGEGIANLNGSVVMQTNNIARPRFIYVLTITGNTSEFSTRRYHGIKPL